MKSSIVRLGSSKAQSSLEFLVLVGFMVLVFSGFFLVVQGRLATERQLEKQDQLENLADLLESELLIAHSVREGFVRPIELPETLKGESYKISINDSDELSIKTDYGEHLIFLPFPVVIFNGSNILTEAVLPRNIILEKNNDTLYVQIACSSQPESISKLCDGLDNDCNNYVDDGALNCFNNSAGVQRWLCEPDNDKGFDIPCVS